MVAIESIAKSFETFEDVILDLDLESWTERLEWYLNEFYLLAKSKIIDSLLAQKSTKIWFHAFSKFSPT